MLISSCPRGILLSSSVYLLILYLVVLPTVEKYILRSLPITFHVPISLICYISFCSHISKLCLDAYIEFLNLLYKERRKTGKPLKFFYFCLLFSERTMMEKTFLNHRVTERIKRCENMLWTLMCLISVKG